MLNNAANNANDLADELKRYGFVVNKTIELTGDAAGADRFYAEIEEGSVALIFFDGFGVQSNRAH